MDLAGHVLGHSVAPKRKGKKQMMAMHVKMAKGGHIVTHDYAEHPSEEHVVPSKKALLEHMQSNLPEEDAELPK